MIGGFGLGGKSRRGRRIRRLGLPDGLASGGGEGDFWGREDIMIDINIHVLSIWQCFNWCLSGLVLQVPSLTLCTW